MGIACELHDDFQARLRDHEKRISALERHGAEFAVRLEHLCKKLDELTAWIKTLVFTILGAFGGFVIWYIQSLPR